MIDASPERKPDQGNSGHQTKDDHDDRPCRGRVGQYKYQKTQEDQQQTGRKQPDDGRSCPVLQRLVDVLAAGIHGVGSRSQE